MNVSPDRTLKVENVSRSFRRGGEDVLAVKDVSLSIAPSEVVSLIGPSGCGKSTVLRMAAGFDRPDSGAIRVGGKIIRTAASDRGIVFQKPALFPWLNVFDNVILGPRMRGVDPTSYKKDAREYIRAVKLEGFEDHFPYQLSGGMLQRAQIARVLINRPEILLMDEPFGALDFQTRLEMQRLMLTLWRSYHQSVLFITHDVDEAIFLSDRIYVMSARPGCIRAAISVPFGRDRDFVAVTTSPEAAEIKRQTLELLGYTH